MWVPIALHPYWHLVLLCFLSSPPLPSPPLPSPPLRGGGLNDLWITFWVLLPLSWRVSHICSGISVCRILLNLRTLTVFFHLCLLPVHIGYFLLGWLIESHVHTFTNLYQRISCHTRSVLFWKCFLSLARSLLFFLFGSTADWEFLPFKLTSLLINNYIFKIFFFSCFTVSTQVKPSHNFNTLHRNGLSQIASFILTSSTLPQNTRMWIQFSQAPYHLLTKVTFPPVSNNIYLISVWDVTDWPLLLLKKQIRLGKCKDLTDFIWWFMNWAASHLADRKELQRAVQN